MAPRQRCAPTPCCCLLQGALAEERAGRTADAECYEAALQAAADEATQTAVCYEDALQAAADEAARLQSAVLARAREQLATAQARLRTADHAAMTLFRNGCDVRDQLAATRARLQTADRAVMTLFRRPAEAGQASDAAAPSEQPQQQEAACSSWGVSAELQAALQAQHPSLAAAESQVCSSIVLLARLHATRLTVTRLHVHYFGCLTTAEASQPQRSEWCFGPAAASALCMTVHQLSPRHHQASELLRASLDCRSRQRAPTAWMLRCVPRSRRQTPPRAARPPAQRRRTAHR